MKNSARKSYTLRVKFNTTGYGWSKLVSAYIPSLMTTQDKKDLDALNTFAKTNHQHPIDLESDFRVNFEKYLIAFIKTSKVFSKTITSVTRLSTTLTIVSGNAGRGAYTYYENGGGLVMTSAPFTTDAVDHEERHFTKNYILNTTVDKVTSCLELGVGKFVYSNYIFKDFLISMSSKPFVYKSNDVGKETGYSNTYSQTIFFYYYEHAKWRNHWSEMVRQNGGFAETWEWGAHLGAPIAVISFTLSPAVWYGNPTIANTKFRWRLVNLPWWNRDQFINSFQSTTLGTWFKNKTLTY